MTKIKNQLCSHCFSENDNNYLLQYVVKKYHRKGDDFWHG